MMGMSDGKVVHFMNATNPNSHPAWSPDGKMIAFVAAKDRDPDIADKNISLWGIYVSQYRRERAKALAGG